MKSVPVKTIFFIICLFCATFRVQAAPIYKWTDESGNVHYSSAAKDKRAKEAALPEIMRGESKVPASQLVSCKDHGGINCQIGPDKDGSVICGDGFTEAVQRYRFSCSAPKLEIYQISEKQPDGSYSVFVRNSRSVTAKNAVLALKIRDDVSVNLDGPKEIEAHGVGEYKYSWDKAKTVIGQNIEQFNRPTLEKLDLNCQNCPG
jgi:Domain of unknown function (DUF4124)